MNGILAADPAGAGRVAESRRRKIAGGRPAEGCASPVPQNLPDAHPHPTARSIDLPNSDRTAGMLQPWPAYAFAIVATAVTLGLRLALAGELQDRPTLIVFTVPIMLSAYLGGLRAGLLATALSYVGASFFVLPPFHSFRVASVVDRWDIFFVMLAGVVISGLNEALHRARHRAAEAIGERAERDRQRFFTLSLDAVCILGFDGYFKDVNPAWERTLGFTRAELLAAPFIEFVHPDDREATLAEAAKVAGGKSLIAFENRYRRQDGAYRVFQWSVTPVLENAVMYGVARDITERKLEEKASIQLAAIVDSSDDAIIGKDVNGIVTSWNRGAEKIFGYTAAEMTGSSILRLIPADRHEEEKQILARIRRDESVEPFETLRQTKDGRLIDISVTASPIKDSTGKVTGVSKVARCISERKQVEAALRESEALLHASDRRLAEIVQGMTEACFTLDAEWRFTFVNDRGESLLRHPREEMLGRSIWEVLRQLVGTPMEGHYRRAMAERVPVSFEAFSPVAERWLDIRLFPAGDGIAAFLLDVQARKAGEEARRGSEARYRALFECAPDGIVVADPAGVYLEANGSVCQMLGYTRAELVGLPSSSIVAEAESHHIGPALSAINAVAPYHREWQFRRKDHSFFAAEVIATKMPDGNLLAMIHDITERRTAEKRIHQLNTELEQRVIERTAQLEAANQELEAFSYSVSHDLRAPLRGVDGYVRMLKEDCAGQLDAEGHRLLDVVSGETQRMGQLVDDLLRFSRLGREQMGRSAVDMTSLAQRVFETSTRLAPESAPRFELESLPAAQGDLSMLRQVFVNLIGNAIKFSRHEAAPLVEVGSRSGDGGTTYHVRDNGVGFDEKYAHKLFGVFQRLHSEEEFEGTGVGLALVQRVIQRHGGQVWAESKPDQGATFYFTLPTQEEPAHEHSH